MAIYKGDEIKFSIELTAQGFSMDDDDFDIEVVSSRGGSVKGSKNPPAGSDTDVIIFSEEVETTIPPAEEGGEPTVETTTVWYAIVKTEKLEPNELRVIATAYVPDANADDGIRKQTAVKVLDNLKKP